MQDAMRNNLKPALRSVHVAPLFLFGLLTNVLGAQASGETLSNVAVSAQTPEAMETIVRLYPVAVVSGEQVTLADVAEIQGTAARLAGGWPIAQAPAPGRTEEIVLGEIRAALARRGINLSQWIFRGASRCKVTRSTEMPMNAASRSRVAVDSETVAVQGDSLEVSVVADGIHPDSLEAALRIWLANQLPKQSGTPVIRFSVSTQLASVMALTSPPYRFEIAEVGKRKLGDVAVEVTVFEGQLVRQVLQILANVSLRVPVVQATRAINRGETITENMVELRQRDFERMEDIGLKSLPLVIGQRARNFINNAEIVQARHLEPLPLVERNDLVTVWVRRGPLVVKSSARASGAGTYGSVIELRSLMSRETFLATVTGPKTVELVEETADSMLGAVVEGGRP
ncbi:MAG: flagellar basal body P-ring formation protein FlgA [Phycisphaerales bacterium]|nr:flagellar basal body P-ring formation protein FlgA [Phycisphaerales bacterium]